MPTQSRTNRMIALFLAVVGLSLLIAMILPGFQRSRETISRQLICNYSLKGIGLALHQYHEDFGTFPPAYVADENGKPMHSWRVLLLPYLGRKNLYDRYDFSQPWSSPHNLSIADDWGPAPESYLCGYCCGEPFTNTTAVAVTGDGTFWAGAQSISRDEIKDGAENTICVVGITNSKIHWMEPRDLRIDEIGFERHSAVQRDIASSHGKGGVHVLFADGSCQFLNDSISKREFKAFFTREGREVVPRSRLSRGIGYDD
jgi:prepilin-type processing-associated H-X9-DG protein